MPFGSTPFLRSGASGSGAASGFVGVAGAVATGGVASAGGAGCVGVCGLDPPHANSVMAHSESMRFMPRTMTRPRGDLLAVALAGRQLRLGLTIRIEQRREVLRLLCRIAAAELDQLGAVVAVEQEVRQQVVLVRGLAGGQLLDQAARDHAGLLDPARAHVLGGERADVLGGPDMCRVDTAQRCAAE